jgi:outer membrane lipopolysaccharide assembly protein LptE/RlpB
MIRALALLGSLLVAASCGYHVAGRADTVPKTVRTIYVPAWSNNTVQYRLTDVLPEQIAREFIARSRYVIVNKIEDADAVLTGSVVTYAAFPTVFDPVTGRAAGVQITVTLSTKLTEQKTGKVLFNRPGFAFNQRYEISTNSEVYFEESAAALDRLSREVARSLVSAILEGF